ncbi:MAG: ankyrin repeat domain-containing protein [Pseudolabrys sp.]
MGRSKFPSKTALFEAARRWDVTSVKTILRAAPDLAKASDAKGRTALHIACAVNPRSGPPGEPTGVKTVTAILKAGADLETEVPMDEDEGDFRATALWYAVARGENLPLVRFLLSRGADPSYSLWAAVWRDDSAMCRHLLKARPRINLKAGPDRETPVFYAARLKRLKTLELLIKAGADPCIKDGRGRDALEIARARRLPQKFIDLLTRAMTQVSARH